MLKSCSVEPFVNSFFDREGKKSIVLEKFSDYSNQKLNSCDKGCGGKIYFDEDFKTEEGKFIPIDRNTGRPHNCQKIKYKNKI